NAITSSTVSRLSAPRSSIKLAPSETLDSSTPKCSTTIFFTRSAILSLIPQKLPSDCGGSFHTNLHAECSCAAELTRLPRHCQPGPSYHREAAIDVQRRAGHVGGFLAREINDRGGNLRRRAEAAGRNVARDTLVLLLRQHGGHRRLDEAGRHAIH